MSNEALFQKIDRYAAVIRSRRPLSEAEVRELDAYYKIGTTYSSNALEGNSLTLSETKVLLEDGITVGGKPIRDCYEATGHAKAYDYMLSVARSGNPAVTEDVIRHLHFLFYHGIAPGRRTAGKTRRPASGGVCRLRSPPSGGHSSLSGRQRAHGAAADESAADRPGLLCRVHPARSAA